MSGKAKNLKGQKFGNLIAIEQQGVHITRKTAMWLCKCDCGNEKLIAAHDLKHGTVSCGCVARQSKLKNLSLGHGWNKGIEGESKLVKLEKKRKYAMLRLKAKTKNKRIHCIWGGMNERCYHENHVSYANYGGRGIAIHEEWRNDYYSFQKWALSNGYEEHLTIDRINNNGNYEPSNCRWATSKEQANNMSSNRLITIDGITKNMGQWSDQYNIKRSTFSERLRHGKTGKELIRKVGVYNG